MLYCSTVHSIVKLRPFKLLIFKIIHTRFLLVKSYAMFQKACSNVVLRPYETYLAVQRWGEEVRHILRNPWSSEKNSFTH